MKIEELLRNYNQWATDVVNLRLDNKEKSRDWLYKQLGLTYTPELKKLQEFFDRTAQNEEYVKRYNEESIPAKKPHAWYQTEINMIYSFHKCFAMRYNTRLQYYRNDMSQKGKRNITAINQALAKFMLLRDMAEKEPG